MSIQEKGGCVNSAYSGVRVRRNRILLYFYMLLLLKNISVNMCNIATVT